MRTTITLTIEGSAAAEETIAGWEAETYRLDGGARGTGIIAAPDPLKPDDVVELELANGMRLLVAAGDLDRYLGSAPGRGEDKAGEITVGQALRLTGPRLPEGLSREGIGAWLLKGLKIFRRGPAGMTALIAAGSFQDGRLDHRLGLYRCATDRWH